MEAAGRESVSDAEREEILDRLAAEWAARGWRVETRSRFQATMVTGSGAVSRAGKGGLIGVIGGRKLRRVVVSVTDEGAIQQTPVA